MILKNSGWVLSLSVFHQPEIIGQPPSTSVWWGYGALSRTQWRFCAPNAWIQCSGAEILEETLRHLRFERHLVAIMASSICVPCNMPYVNNIWLPRPPRRQASPQSREVDQSRTHRPVRRGSFREIAFTIECSVRSAWQAIYVLLKRGPAPPPVYQGQYDRLMR